MTDAKALFLLGAKITGWNGEAVEEGRVVETAFGETFNEGWVR